MEKTLWAAYFNKSVIKNIQNKVYTMDTLSILAEAQDVQGESKRNGFVQPEEEKAHCYLQISNVRVQRSQSQTLLRATMLKDRRQKAQAEILTWCKEKKKK